MPTSDVALKDKGKGKSEGRKRAQGRGTVKG